MTRPWSPAPDQVLSEGLLRHRESRKGRAPLVGGDSRQGMTEKTNDPQSWFLEISKDDKQQINSKVLL